MDRQAVMVELEALRRKSKDGLLHPAAVVKAAQSPKSAMHSMFDWDDSIAAQKWRLVQARDVIRSVRITNPTDAFRPPSPCYVSLMADREEGGYHHISEVVDDDDLREALRETALNELRSWMKRYRTLVELVDAVSAAAGLEEEAVA